MVITGGAAVRSWHHEGQAAKMEEPRSRGSGLWWSRAGATGQHVELGLIPPGSEGCRRLLAGSCAITIMNCFKTKKKLKFFFFCSQKKEKGALKSYF